MRDHAFSGSRYPSIAFRIQNIHLAIYHLFKSFIYSIPDKYICSIQVNRFTFSENYLSIVSRKGFDIDSYWLIGQKYNNIFI